MLKLLAHTLKFLNRLMSQYSETQNIQILQTWIFWLKNRKNSIVNGDKTFPPK